MENLMWSFTKLNNTWMRSLTYAIKNMFGHVILPCSGTTAENTTAQSYELSLLGDNNVKYNIFLYKIW